MLPRLILLGLVIAVAYMTLWFLVAWWRKRLPTSLLMWGGAYVPIAWLVVWQQPAIRTYMVAFMVTAWAARLTYHIARRNYGNDQGRSAAKVQETQGRRAWLKTYLFAYLPRAILVLLISLPIITNAGTALPDLRLLFTIGYVVWAVGFYVEYRADSELQRFKADKSNEGKVLNAGLWSSSRHPNYFGELLQWWGIGLIAAQTSFGWLGLAGPLLLTLIMCNASIPRLEKGLAKDKAYQDYKQRTRTLLPWPPAQKS